MKSRDSRPSQSARRKAAVRDVPPKDNTLGPCFVPHEYESRADPSYFEDFAPGSNHKIYQPDVYSLAALMASIRGGRLIDIGCGKAEKLLKYSRRFKIVGVDFGPNIEYCARTHRWGEWISHDLESEAGLPLPLQDLQGAVIVCADVIEHLLQPLILLGKLRRCVDSGACVLLSTPERMLLRGTRLKGPPSNPNHVREWKIGELRALLLHLGFEIQFLGLTANNHVDRRMSTILAVLSRLNVNAMPGSS